MKGYTTIICVRVNIWLKDGHYQIHVQGPSSSHMLAQLAIISATISPQWPLTEECLIVTSWSYEYSGYLKKLINVLIMLTNN